MCHDGRERLNACLEGGGERKKAAMYLLFQGGCEVSENVRNIQKQTILSMRHTEGRDAYEGWEGGIVSENYFYTCYSIITNMSEVISTRIPKELKEEMKRVNVNWEDFVRRAIEEKVKEEKRKMAVKMMDESRKKTEGIKFDSVEVIRGLREKR